MSDHFIREIEIKDYKLFHDFEAKGFGRVNLISGKNNVGKTAFMEAACINVYSNSVSTMTDVLTSPKQARNFLEIGVRFLEDEEKKEYLEASCPCDIVSNIQKTKFQIVEDGGIKHYGFEYANNRYLVNINDFSFERNKRDDIKLITQLGFTKVQLKHVFEAVQKHDKENILYEHIQLFDSNIVNFKIIGGDKPQCKTKDGIYRDINEFGDGLKRFISTICSLYATENGYLFIDEIDNGIHYTQLDHFWEVILTLSKEQNVQVFATTHSKECIESYARLAKRLEDDEMIFVGLGRDKQGDIQSIILDRKSLEFELNQNHEVRGW